MVPPGDIVQRFTLATAFRDLKTSTRRFSDKTLIELLHKPDGRLLNRIGAAALDALASLAVCAPNETVALAAVLNRHGHIELCIAADTEEVPCTVVDHLNDICSRFLNIRATIEASSNKDDILDTVRQDPHISKGCPEPALAALRLLELDLYTYSSPRIRARIADAPFDWLDSLSHLVACLKGAPADARDDLSDGERAALGSLQQSVRVQRYLRRFEREISYLQDFMRGGPDVDVDAVRLRQHSVTLAVDSHLLEADMPQFDHFISSHITRTTGTPPRESPPTHEWIKKVTYVNAAFDALTRILVTPVVSAMFGAHVPIHPIINVPPEHLHAAVLTADNIKATLATPLLYGWNASSFSPHNPAAFDNLVAELLAAEAGSGHATRMHCECALLSHLCKHDQPMLPYIGLSQAPCVLCACYVAAYRDYRGFETTMRRAEGRPASIRWICPDFPDRPEDAVAFQNHFNRRLSTYIVRRMLDENARVLESRHTQNTSTSNVQESPA